MHARSFSQYLVTQDGGFLGRVAAVLVSEKRTGGAVPSILAGELAPYVAAEPGITDAYHAALISGRDDAGIADDVITDGALTSAVVAVLDRYRPARVKGGQ